MTFENNTVKGYIKHCLPHFNYCLKLLNSCTTCVVQFNNERHGKIAENVFNAKNLCSKERGSILEVPRFQKYRGKQWNATHVTCAGLVRKNRACKLQYHGLFDSYHHWSLWARWDQTGTDLAAWCIVTYWRPISPLCSLQFSHWLQEREKGHS